MQLDKTQILERTGLAEPVTDLLPKHERLLVEVRRTRDVSLRFGQHASAIQRSGANWGGYGVAISNFECALQAVPAFKEVPPHPPEMPQRTHQPDDCRSRPALLKVVEGRPHVIVLQGEQI